VSEQVTGKELLAQGYRKHPSRHNGAIALYQKAFDDSEGRKYFITFYEWDVRGDGCLSYDAQIISNTNTGGTAWITLKEPTVQQTEERALIIWNALGAIYYEVA